MADTLLQNCSLVAIVGEYGKQRLVSDFAVGRDGSQTMLSLHPLEGEDGPVIFLIGDDLRTIAREILKGCDQ